MRCVFLDFESYFNTKDKYTLTKMGPIEYIRDPRFFVQCVGFRIDRGQTHVVSYKNGLDRQVLNALHLDEPGTITVGHNINGFDALVLSEHYGIKPYMIVDTISLMNWLGLSRIMSCSHKVLTDVLHHGVKQAGTVVSNGKRTIEEFTPEDWQFFMQYCSDDVTQCSENFYSMLPHVKNIDALKLMSLTAKMGTEPSFIPDGEMLEEYVQKLDSDAEQKRIELAQFLHFPDVETMLKNIRSRTNFPRLLEAIGCQCPMKWSEKQNKEIPAISKTDLEFTKLLQHEDPRVRALVSARLEQNSSIQKSRATSLLDFKDKPIPILLGAFKAHTGRYTAGNEGTSDGLNFQNLSKRDPSKLTLRKALKVPKGYKVVACDSSQIEARILAWVAGQEDLVAQFREGRDPYAEMAAKIFNRDAKEIHDGAKQNDHPEHNMLKMERNVGKTCILSCLSADTEVLTDTGWKPIISVTRKDKLWDGEQWVNHTGLSYNGMKRTIELDGLRLTADHLIWNGTTWNVADEYRKTPSSIKSAMKFATESLKMCESSNATDIEQLTYCYDANSVRMSYGLRNTMSKRLRQTVAHIVQNVQQQGLNILDKSILTHNQELNSVNLQSLSVSANVDLPSQNHVVQNAMHLCNVAVEQNHIGYYLPTCVQENLQDVTYVQKRNQLLHTQRNTQAMQISAQTQNYADAYSTGLPASSKDVIAQPVEYTLVMGDVALNVCSIHAENFLNIFLHWKDMITQCCRLIGLTTTETMRKVISDFLHRRSKSVIVVLYKLCKHVFKNLKQNSQNTKVEPVYDLLNAGPNHRFTVRTKHGALLVHNCGYGVSAKKFSDTLLRTNVKLNEDLNLHEQLATHAHSVYRQVSYAIVNFWRYCDNILRFLTTVETSQEYGTFGAHNEFKYGRDFIPCTDKNCSYIEMPNGYRIWYPDLITTSDNSMVYVRITHGKPTQTRIYGAGMVENICQSLAFMLLSWQACRMADRGVQLKANIHDAWITVVPEDKAEETKQIMEEVMSSVPEWLEGFPVGCEAEIGEDFTIA